MHFIFSLIPWTPFFCPMYSFYGLEEYPYHLFFKMQPTCHLYADPLYVNPLLEASCSAICCSTTAFLLKVTGSLLSARVFGLTCLSQRSSQSFPLKRVSEHRDIGWCKKWRDPLICDYIQWHYLYSWLSCMYWLHGISRAAHNCTMHMIMPCNMI